MLAFQIENRRLASTERVRVRTAESDRVMTRARQAMLQTALKKQDNQRESRLVRAYAAKELKSITFHVEALQAMVDGDPAHRSR